MRWRGIAYGAHDARWGWEPLSGRGAECNSGRFNRYGTKTLYLALTIDGLIVETAHGLGHRADKLTIFTAQIDLDDVIDLRSTARLKAEGIALEELSAAWARSRSSEVLPTTWTLAAKLMGRGASGILVPSFAPGAKPESANLVVWRWGDKTPHKVALG